MAKNYSEYIATEYGSIVGATITKVRQMTQAELDESGWEDCYGSVAMVIELSNGECLIPSMDPEGNGAGHIFVEQVA
jgi:hypothetical protein